MMVDIGAHVRYTPVIIPLRFLLLASMMIPISLKVSLVSELVVFAASLVWHRALLFQSPGCATAQDLAKFLYSRFIGWDQNMYDLKRDVAGTCLDCACHDPRSRCIEGCKRRLVLSECVFDVQPRPPTPPSARISARSESALLSFRVSERFVSLRRAFGSQRSSTC